MSVVIKDEYIELTHLLKKIKCYTKICFKLYRYGIVSQLHTEAVELLEWVL